MPDRILTKVDLPAPFSPISAWTSPAFRSKLTRSSARTPGKLFEMSCISSKGAVIRSCPSNARTSQLGACCLLRPGAVIEVRVEIDEPELPDNLALVQGWIIALDREEVLFMDGCHGHALPVTVLYIDY